MHKSGYSSDVKNILCGVPQGSTQVPLLFLVDINDLQSVFSSKIIHSSADDTNLLFPSKKRETIESVKNPELKMLVQWLRSNKTSFNESKTETIVFRYPLKKLFCDPDIRIDDYKHKLHQLVKYLQSRTKYLEQNGVIQ